VPTFDLIVVVDLIFVSDSVVAAIIGSLHFGQITLLLLSNLTVPILIFSLQFGQMREGIVVSQILI